jgi:CRISPR-associated endoribonuclease Cas6
MGVIVERIKVNVWVERSETTRALYDHKYALYTHLLKTLSVFSPHLSTQIHDGEIKRGFLFSNLIFNTSDPKRSTKAHFYVVSARSDVMKGLLKGFTTVNRLNFDGFSLLVKDVSVQRMMVNDGRFTFLSPVILRYKDGSVMEEFDKEEFEELTTAGLLRVGKVLGVDGDVHVEFVGEPLKKKLYKIKNTYWRAFSATSSSQYVIVKGDERWWAVTSYFGIGDKVHMGFGMMGVKEG